MLSPVILGPQHAFSTQEAPPLGRSRFDRDWSFAAGARTRADLSDRLRDPLVSVWRLAGFSTMRPGSRRIHSADYPLAGGTATANLALSHGSLL